MKRNEKAPRIDQLGGTDKIPPSIQEKVPEKTEKKSNSKKWIVFTSILIICLILIWHFSQNNNKTNNNNVPSTTITTENQNSKENEATIEPSSKRTRTLDVGFYTFDMKAGEQTGWIRMPTDKNVICDIGSPDGQWIIEYKDGTILNGWENPILPSRKNLVFKLKSLINQKINVKITEY